MEELKCTISVEGSKIFIDELDLSSGKLVRHFMDAKEAKIREALIEMGWTPPNEEKPTKESLPFSQRDLKATVLSAPEETRTPRFKIYAPLASKSPAKKEDLSPIEKGLLAEFPCLGGGVIKVFSGKPPELEETPPSFKAIHEAFRTLTHAVHANAVEHGWFDTEMPNKEMEFLVGMAGVMKECGEALEVVSARQWDALDEKCPQHTKLSVELADVVLRLLTLCGRHNINIGAAITAKHEYNRSRPYRHGGKAF